MQPPIAENLQTDASGEGSGASGRNRHQQVEALKRFLRIESERLRMRHRSGRPGQEIATARSRHVDLVLTRICQLVTSEAGRDSERDLAQVAMVALGGYGRSELAPFSDVDLLFLHGGRPPDAVKRFVEEVLKLLWDVKLTVGHSFRSAGECVDIAMPKARSTP